MSMNNIGYLSIKFNFKYYILRKSHSFKTHISSTLTGAGNSTNSILKKIIQHFLNDFTNLLWMVIEIKWITNETIFEEYLALNQIRRCNNQSPIL